MSNNEPTEEQRAAVRAIAEKEGARVQLWHLDDIARLLAEREAKLREGSSFFVAKVGEQHKELIAQEEELERRGEKILELRARVAELESEAARVCRVLQTDNLGIVVQIFEEMSAENKSLHEMLSDHEEEEGIWIPRSEFKELPMRAAPSREAQLLADIKELDARLARAVDIIVSEELDRDFGEEPTPRILAVRALLTECGYQPERCSRGAVIGYSGTAHYDDAKADAPAVDMQAWANGTCPEPGCSLANPHEQGVACVKPTAEGGEG